MMLWPGQLRHVLSIDPVPAKWFVASGVLVTVSQMFFYMALAVAPVSVVMPILQLHLVFRFLMARLMNPHHEMFGGMMMLATAISVTGAAALSLDPEFVIAHRDVAAGPAGCACCGGGCCDAAGVPNQLLTSLTRIGAGRVAKIARSPRQERAKGRQERTGRGTMVRPGKLSGIASGAGVMSARGDAHAQTDEARRHAGHADVEPMFDEPLDLTMPMPPSASAVRSIDVHARTAAAGVDQQGRDRQPRRHAQCRDAPGARLPGTMPEQTVGVAWANVTAPGLMVWDRPRSRPASIPTSRAASA